MKKYVVVLQMLFVLLLVSGCSQKVTIKALEPAEVDRAAYTKVIAVTKFEYDRVGLSGKIESKLSKYSINSKPFFKMVSRGDIDKILDEQKLQNSGLVELSNVVEAGKLMGAQAIISGSVGRVSSSDTHFYEGRSRCADKKCKEIAYYNVRCVKRVVGLSAELKMVDVTRGDIIYADDISKSSIYKSCVDDSNALPSKDMVAQRLADSIADTFTYKLTPHYRYFSVELLEDADLDYDDEQEILLESSLEYIKQGRYEKAQKLLIRLIDSTDRQSYVAFYNLGVVQEAKGEYLSAKEYYEKADSLVIKPVEVISDAYLRINSTIENHQKTQEQINR